MSPDDISKSKLLVLIMGYGIAPAIACAVELRLAERLAPGPMSCQDLALAAECSPDHLCRLLRALCSVGLFVERDGNFHSTALSKMLRRDVEGSLWPLALFHGQEMHAVTGNLASSVRTGVPAWQTTFGKSVWEYFAENEERGDLFDQTMRLHHSSDLRAMVAICDFASARVIVDVGGGDGSMLREVLQRHSGVRGVLFDLPGVIERARRQSGWEELASRMDFVAGDMFEALPKGGDVYILRHVLHDWSDEQSQSILYRCSEVMNVNSRLWVIEDAVRTDFAGAWADLGVMMFGGRERTSEEFEALFSGAALVVRARRKLPKSLLFELALNK